MAATSLFKKCATYILPLAHVALTGKPEHDESKYQEYKHESLCSASIYLTLAIAVERYVTVCHPFFKVSNQQYCVKYGGDLDNKGGWWLYKYGAFNKDSGKTHQSIGHRKSAKSSLPPPIHSAFS